MVAIQTVDEIGNLLQIWRTWMSFFRIVPVLMFTIIFWVPVANTVYADFQTGQKAYDRGDLQITPHPPVLPGFHRL